MGTYLEEAVAAWGAVIVILFVFFHVATGMAWEPMFALIARAGQMLAMAIL